MKKVMLLIAAVILTAAYCSAKDVQGANAETVVNITKFGAKGDGKKIATKAINKAIEKAGNGGDVDCISGATITSKGVESMLISGLAPYVEAGWFDQVEPALNLKAVMNENEVENRECDEK